MNKKLDNIVDEVLQEIKEDIETVTDRYVVGGLGRGIIRGAIVGAINIHGIPTLLRKRCEWYWQDRKKFDLKPFSMWEPDVPFISRTMGSLSGAICTLAVNVESYYRAFQYLDNLDEIKHPEFLFVIPLITNIISYLYETYRYVKYKEDS